MSGHKTSNNEIVFDSVDSEEVFRQMTALNLENLGTNIGLEFLNVGKKRMSARMPVDKRTIQPFGLLHGGASVALAETLCSIGAFLNTNTKEEMAVGLEINANHLKPVRTGYVTGNSIPVHIGKRTQVWETKITDGSNRLICVSRCTLAIVKRR